MNYTTLKKRVLERYFKRTNEMQREAIFRINGSVLIIAGAGSGKTTVLCNRIANMLLFGNAYSDSREKTLSAEDERFLEEYADGKIDTDAETAQRLSDIIGCERILPWKILAVTFTNKAAAELKERLSNMNAPAKDVWAFTFHSACVRILRRGIEDIGYKSNFTIYDSDDSLRVIKSIMKDLNMSDKTYNPKVIQTMISHAKDKLISPCEFSADDKGKRDFIMEKTRDVYLRYQEKLKAANALDFDDIIMKTVELLEKCPDILEYWQEHFRYIMVDEYQDTNHAQYRLVSLLAQKYGNLCVVGDEDQSIYRFRGATIENILNFENEFDSKVIKLEQNYRSTQNILDAANAVIANNTQRKPKSLWSDMGEGDKISLNRFTDEQTEALFVANTIMTNKGEGNPFSNNAILYRTNAQSRTFELALNRVGVPYRIIGGVKFYDRKEVKDMLAYLCVVNNPFDSVRFMRIINEPKRQIGDVTQAEIVNIAEGLGISPVEVLCRADEFQSLVKKAKVLMPLGEMFRELSQSEAGIDTILDTITEQSGYAESLMKAGDEGQGRLENIRELKSNMISFMEENTEGTLSDYLEQVALISDMDNYEADEDKAVLMTMHSAKGLEFDTVFLVGAEENLFPSFRSMQDPTETEEERRLAYVAITRAKKHLYITCARQRLIYGQTMRNKISRFVSEIPQQYIELNDTTMQSVQHEHSSAKPKKEPGYLQTHNVPVSYTKPASTGIIFNMGDRVSHKVFGDGTVLDAKAMGNDYLLEIAFDKVGTKKIMANFAKIIKL